MSDAELDQIRAARLAQLQQSSSSSQHPSSSGGGSNHANSEDAEARANEARQSMLLQILQPAAQDRLNRIRLVKASRAEDVENRLIQLARTGQLREKVSEEQLKELLAAISENEGPGGGAGEGGPRIEYRGRRKGGWDDEDDEDLEELLRR